MIIKPYSKWNKVSLNNNVNKDLEKLPNELAKSILRKNTLVKQIVLLSNINNDKKIDLEIVKDFLKNIIEHCWHC